MPILRMPSWCQVPCGASNVVLCRPCPRRSCPRRSAPSSELSLRAEPPSDFPFHAARPRAAFQAASLLPALCLADASSVDRTTTSTLHFHFCPRFRPLRRRPRGCCPGTSNSAGSRQGPTALPPRRPRLLTVRGTRAGGRAVGTRCLKSYNHPPEFVIQNLCRLSPGYLPTASLVPSSTTKSRFWCFLLHSGLAAPAWGGEPLSK